MRAPDDGALSCDEPDRIRPAQADGTNCARFIASESSIDHLPVFQKRADLVKYPG